jgi:hypothetical protein
MNSRGYYLIGMLVLLFLANIAMLMGLTNWPQRVREGFASSVMGSSGSKSGSGSAPQEHFMNYLVPNSFTTDAIGPYDNINLAANLPPASQGYKANTPNEPLAGPPITLDNDHLLIFTNNQCKPECCGSTMSCNGGGCVCTTPEQRDLINCRGGNRCGKGDRSDDGF